MDQKIHLKNNDLYVFGPFRLNTGERLLMRDGEPVALPRKVFDLLAALVTSPGHLKTRAELIEALWPDTIVEEQGLTTKMHALRKALGDEGEAPVYIETVRGVGYRFIAPVSVEGHAGTASDMALPAKAKPRPRHAFRLYGSIVAALAIIAGLLIWRFAFYGSGPAMPPGVAVLPFANLSADRSNAYFADGIRDTILTRLASLGDLRVISRSSSNRYASRPGNLRQVGHELGVEAILEGSVQKAGGRVLINVQLINAKNDNHIWASTYTRTLKDIFAVEGEVASKVAAALESRLRPAELARLAQPPTHDPEAYLLYLKANYDARRALDLANAEDPSAAVNRAASLYRQALARDPEFALAWARLSLLDSKAYWFEIDHTAARIAAAKEAAKQAIMLDPSLAQAHMARGYAYYYGSLDYVAALEQFTVAHRSLPHNADVIGAIAFIHRRQGRWQKALSEFARAATLDPRNPRWPDVRGITLMALRRYPEAAQQFAQALAIAPRDYDAKVRQIYLLLLEGKVGQANEELAAIPPSADPQGLISELRFDVALFARKPDAALAVLDAAKAWNPRKPLRADAWALEGDTKRARNYYQKASAVLRGKLKQDSQNSDLWSALGLAEAGSGNKAAALAAGRRAAALNPVSRDALAGPFYLVTLAKIHARFNEAVAAVKLLGRLLAMPAGRAISVPLLKLDPAWDPIRRDPAFRALLKRYSKPTASAIP